MCSLVRWFVGLLVCWFVDEVFCGLIVRSDQIGLMLEQLVAVDVQQGGVNVVVVGEDEVVAVLFKREVDGCVDEDLIAVGDGEVLDGVAAAGESEAI